MNRHLSGQGKGRAHIDELRMGNDLSTTISGIAIPIDAKILLFFIMVKKMAEKICFTAYFLLLEVP